MTRNNLPTSQKQKVNGSEQRTSASISHPVQRLIPSSASVTVLSNQRVVRATVPKTNVIKPAQPQHFQQLRQIAFSSSQQTTTGNDIRFVTMNTVTSASVSALPSQPNRPPQNLPAGVSYVTDPNLPLFDGPFQIIEPGHELYMETEPSYYLEPLEVDFIDELQDILVSKNGIPEDVLKNAFEMEDELASQGKTLLEHVPVPYLHNLDHYKVSLVGEMNDLFPVPKHRPEPKVQPRYNLLGRTEATDCQMFNREPTVDDPCYMRLMFPQHFPDPNKVELKPQDVARGYRSVNMIDERGKIFTAKYFDHISIKKTSKQQAAAAGAPIANRRLSELISTTQFKDVSPAMRSKIESLASGNLNVTLTPVRSNPKLASPESSSPAAQNTTIVIKAPKRTIATGMLDSEMPSEVPMPMPYIKQEPQEEPVPGPSSDFNQQINLIDSTPVQLPVTTPQLAVSKQPRKQKLQSLTQCEAVFKEGPDGVRTVSASLLKSISTNRINRVSPAGDYVSVTLKGFEDLNSFSRFTSPQKETSTGFASDEA
ncbi:uncharacterized protein LOC129755750 [Uranotaenia lowii]|uniref:uncharacterized protein LOC129755750 n=1 Tax=Uranotaenia lowii TaxID=190385 RepID=UPI002478DD48|nr:uncharacterized protein LOC129755750 [Uranotaenia lowii]